MSHFESEAVDALTSPSVMGDLSVSPSMNSVHGTVTLLVADRLHKLESDCNAQLKEVRERQSEVAFLHKLMKQINAITQSKGELDLSQQPEILSMLEKSKKKGIEVDSGKMKYSSDERERLLENLRMTIEDLNVQNDMQLQMVTRLVNERYESYQLARSILKPLHDDIINKARGMGGR